MKNKLIFTIIVIFVLGFTSFFLSSFAVNLLHAEDLKVDKDMQNQISTDREHLIQNLIKFVEYEAIHEKGRFTLGNHPRNIAICLLGELRAIEAVDILIEELCYRPEIRASGTIKGERDSEIGPPSSFNALIKVGKPAIPQLQEKILITDKECYYCNSAKLIIEIEGKESGVIILKSLLPKIDNNEKKIKVQQIINTYNR